MSVLWYVASVLTSIGLNHFLLFPQLLKQLTHHLPHLHPQLPSLSSSLFRANTAVEDMLLAKSYLKSCIFHFMIGNSSTTPLLNLVFLPISLLPTNKTSPIQNFGNSFSQIKAFPPP